MNHPVNQDDSASSKIEISPTNTNESSKKLGSKTEEMQELQQEAREHFEKMTNFHDGIDFLRDLSEFNFDTLNKPDWLSVEEMRLLSEDMKRWWSLSSCR